MSLENATIKYLNKKYLVVKDSPDGILTIRDLNTQNFEELQICKQDNFTIVEEG